MSNNAERRDRSLALNFTSIRRRSFLKEPGGADRDRTDDLKLAKLALSQLSYGPDRVRREWWAREDLNFRPHAYQACALTN